MERLRGLLLVQSGVYSGTLRAMTDRSGKPAGSNVQESEQLATPAQPRIYGLPDGQESKPVELGGPEGLEPTRFGDWERKGRCIDF